MMKHIELKEAVVIYIGKSNILRWGKKYGDFRYTLQRFKSNHKYLLDPWQRIIKVVIVNLVKTE